jgi:hypothetical protein
MNAKRSKGDPLDIEEVRLVSDLRVMHSKVNELHHIVSTLREKHDECVICKYADQSVLAENIAKVDDIYLWFVKLKQEGNNKH